MRIVFEDNHLLLVDKPAGIPSQPDASGDPSLVDMAREWLREKYAKPGRVYIALLHRLDRPVSGLVLFAKTDKAASRMGGVIRRREMEKYYLALVETRSDPGREARLVDFLQESESGMRVVKDLRPGAREARLSYQTLAQAPGVNRALLQVRLETGVKHQIRAQLAWRGLTILGDFRYGPQGKTARPVRVAGGRAILLHASGLGFTHPVAKSQLFFRSLPPGHWREFVEPWGGEALANLLPDSAGSEVGP
ncbi:MAG: RNA pseudouridine synthase [Planctomycetota bacterium]|nr:RNA pseudouridine synthase [Planctomycetota bacterium]